LVDFTFLFVNSLTFFHIFFGNVIMTCNYDAIVLANSLHSCRNSKYSHTELQKWKNRSWGAPKTTLFSPMNLLRCYYCNDHNHNDHYYCNEHVEGIFYSMTHCNIEAGP
jgi:hypothetical protein